MNEPHLFWTVFSAVLAAIILGGTFFWGLIAYSRREREGTEHTTAGNLIFIAIMMPLAFLILGLYTAL
ncbi:MAG: hypothetical protein KJ052_12150 [Candidatus Hydrogenedentes bacterium]|nr:hypothetical protein [Candidatus Hydrogenedentota bacterium]